MGNLSDNFSDWEFWCPHCRKSPMDKLLLVRLEELRQRLALAYGPVSVSINSGYRCHEYNDVLRYRGYKPSKNSQHLKGKAADLSFPATVDLLGAYEVADKIFEDGGVGLYPRYWDKRQNRWRGNFLHVDTRGKRARWGQWKGRYRRLATVMKKIKKGNT